MLRIYLNSTQANVISANIERKANIDLVADDELLAVELKL